MPPPPPTPLSCQFRELPKRSDMPSYYATVAQPLCLSDLVARSAKGDYDEDSGGLAELWNDLRIIVGNAKSFNETYT